MIIATTNYGLEFVSCMEIEEILGNECEKGRGRVYFEGNIWDAVRLNVWSRSLHKIYYLLDSFEVDGKREDLNLIYKKMKGIDWENYIFKDQSFAIRAERLGNQAYSSLDVAKVSGQAVIDRIKEEKNFRAKVDLDYPDIEIRVEVLEDKCNILLDTTGNSLHRRWYRVYRHPAMLKPTLAYSLIRLADWDPKENLLDPMCGSGTIPIEAALYALGKPNLRKDFLFMNFKFLEKEKIEKIFEWEPKKFEGKIFGFDKQVKHVRGAENNAKMAGVLDFIKFARFDVEWLDTKFEEGEIDKIVTNPPYGKREYYESNLFRDFFFNAEFILDDNGKIVMIYYNKKVDEFAKKFNFYKKRVYEVWNGSFRVKVAIFEKE